MMKVSRIYVSHISGTLNACLARPTFVKHHIEVFDLGVEADRYAIEFSNFLKIIWMCRWDDFIYLFNFNLFFIFFIFFIIR